MLNCSLSDGLVDKGMFTEGNDLGSLARYHFETDAVDQAQCTTYAITPPCDGESLPRILGFLGVGDRLSLPPSSPLCP